MEKVTHAQLCLLTLAEIRQWTKTAPGELGMPRQSPAVTCHNIPPDKLFAQRQINVSHIHDVNMTNVSKASYPEHPGFTQATA